MVTGRAFRTVDVFTRTPFSGNPVAVILDGAGLSTGAMQAIANWTNLSETTFVLPPADGAADYSLRIFTPRAELPFAGHPTIGSAFAVLETGMVTPRDGKIVQHCAKGLIDILVPDDWQAAGLSFAMPPAKLTAAPEAELLIAALGGGQIAPPMVVDVGPRWVVMAMVDGGVVEHVRPDFAALADYDRRHRTTGLTIFGTTRDGIDTQIVRSFAPADGINEDPVCGSGNGAVAAYRQHHGAVAPGHQYVAAQGMSVGRNGRVTIRITHDAIFVGGQAVTCATGTIIA